MAMKVKNTGRTVFAAVFLGPLCVLGVGARGMAVVSAVGDRVVGAGSRRYD